MMTLEEFIKKYEGKLFDDDFYPPEQPYQCVDLFRAVQRDLCGIQNPYPTGTGFADGYWQQRNTNHMGEYFDFINTISDVQPFDICFFRFGSAYYPKSHVAVFVKDGSNGKGVFFGQQQRGVASPCTIDEQPWDGFCGAFRVKQKSIPVGASDLAVGEQIYHSYRQSPKQTPIVISAGLNQVLPITKMDVNALVMAQVAGANYFQMRTDTADPVNTTYGDISAPLSGVMRELPQQDTTLYYDLETGKYGDCTDVHIDPAHNVFSPALVFHDDTYEYADMVGYEDKRIKGSPLVKNSSNYTGVLRFKDGTYALLLAEQQTTPRDMWNDLRGYEDVESLAILDGGGSAQMIRGYNVLRDTGRAIPSTVALVEMYEDDCPTCVIPVDPDDEEEPDGAGSTAELTKVAELENRVKKLEEFVEKLKSVLK